MLENIDKIIEFVTMLSTVLFVICRSNANVKKKIDEHLKPNGGSSIKDALDRIEAKLQTVEATQRALLDLHEADAGHFLTESDGSFFWVSDKFSEIMDIVREDCLGLDWIKAIKESEQMAMYSNWAFIKNTKSTANFTFSTKSGVSVLFRSVPVIDPKDRIVGFVGNIKPVNP